MREWSLTWPNYVRAMNVVFPDWKGTGKPPSFLHIMAFEWRMFGPFAKYTGFHWCHLIPKSSRYGGWKEYFRYPYVHIKWKIKSWWQMGQRAYALISGDAILTETIR